MNQTGPAAQGATQNKPAVEPALRVLLDELVSLSASCEPAGSRETAQTNVEVERVKAQILGTFVARPIAAQPPAEAMSTAYTAWVNGRDLSAYGDYQIFEAGYLAAQPLTVCHPALSTLDREHIARAMYQTFGARGDDGRLRRKWEEWSEEFKEKWRSLYADCFLWELMDTRHSEPAERANG